MIAAKLTKHHRDIFGSDADALQEEIRDDMAERYLTTESCAVCSFESHETVMASVNIFLSDTEDRRALT